MHGFKKDTLSVGAFFILLILLPNILTNEYYINTILFACIGAIIAVGLNLLMGYAGQISLGHAGFYGLAAYTTAVLTTKYSFPIIGGMVAGIALVGVLAFLIGIPTLKLKGHYLAMATLGVGIILYIFFNETVELTGGPNGFIDIPRLAVFGYEVESDLHYYYIVATVLTIIVYISLNLIDSRIGRALRAIHTSEKASQVVGINISKYKIFVFVLSALFAAVAGVLYAHYLMFISPSSFGFKYSIELVVMVVLGGMASVWGAVIGAFFITTLPEFLRDSEDVEILIYGAILIVCMIFMPRGIAGGLQDLFKRFFAGKEKDETG